MIAVRRALALALVGLLVVAVGAVALLALFRRDQHARIGQEILYDDFGFRVQSVHTRSRIGPPDALLGCESGEHFLIVRLEVENHARRVDYDLSKHIPRVEDADDRTFDVDTGATAAEHAELGAPPDPPSIRAGAFWATDLVFRVPAAARDLRLRIAWHEPFAGIDELVSGDRTIALDQ